MARTRSKRPSRITSRRRTRHVPAWGWLATWLVGMSALVTVANFVVVPRVQARMQATDQRVLESLHGEIAPLVSRPVTLTVIERRVSLKGDVASEAERDAIVAAVEGHEGVRGVDDALTVVDAPSAPDPDDGPEGPDAPPSPADPPPAPSFDAPPPAPGPDGPGEPAVVPIPEAPGLQMIDELGEEPPSLEEPDAGPAPGVGPEGPAGSAGPGSGTSALASSPGPTDAARDAAIDSPPGEPPGAPLVESARPASLSVRVDADALRLVGDISSADEALLAGFVGPATGAFDPSYVENTVQAAPDVASARWLEPLTRLLEPMAGLERPGIDIDAERVVVSGIAPSGAARAAVIDAARGLFPDHTLVDRTALGLAPEASPSVGGPVDDPVGADDGVPERELSKTPPEGDPEARRAALRAAFEALPERRILFESGTATFADDSGARVATIAELLRDHPGVRVEIEGHTDASGAARANLALSQKRANAVRDALLEAGVERDRLVAYGYGEGVPLVDNSTPEGRAQNRRIEFRF